MRNPRIMIQGHETIVRPVGYVSTDDQTASEMWSVAANLEVDGSRVINIDTALNVLEDRDDLNSAEEKLLRLLQAAEKRGLEDIIINVS